MSDYPPKIVDMIRIVSEAGNNYSTAARFYSVRFPDNSATRRGRLSTSAIL